MHGRFTTIDIETFPHKAYNWSLWKFSAGPNMLIEPGYVISYAWKVNNGKTQFRSMHDEDFYSTLHQVLDMADCLITYNGDKFDMKHIRRELLLNGYPPVRPVPSIDLYKVVKSEFHFASNRLDYVAGEVLDEHKLETGGFSLWPAFVSGEPTALRMMERYNKRDVNITWRLYRALRAYIRNHPHVGPGIGIEDSDEQYECPVCQSEKIAWKRERRTRCYAIRQVQCGNCQHWYDGKRKKL